MTSQHEQHLKEIAIAKLVALGLTEEELKAIGIGE